jgi:hypothetical protein
MWEINWSDVLLVVSFWHVRSVYFSILFYIICGEYSHSVMRQRYKFKDYSSVCTWIGSTSCFSRFEGLEVLQLRSILSVAGKIDAGSPLVEDEPNEPLCP